MSRLDLRRWTCLGARGAPQQSPILRAGIGLKLGVALGEHCLLASGELRGRGHVTQCAMQANLVVMKDEVGHDAPRIFHGQRRAWAHAVGFDSAVEAFELAVALRIVGRKRL